VSEGSRRIWVSHLSCVAVLWTGASPVAVLVAGLTYVVRMLGVTAGYHRYFSHGAFRTGRGFQLALALAGAASGQRGPLWWAARHRHHHRTSDTDADVHSPVTGSFWHAHIGWLARDEYRTTDLAEVPDLARYPELLWLDRHYSVVIVALIVALGGLGAWLAAVAPQLGTSAAQMIVWGFFVSTLACGHATMSVNSLGHTRGYRSFETRDDSRNSWLVALVTLGDGWHNNHHRWPTSARHGLTRFEPDVTWWVLCALARVGIVWDLKEARAP
jgi:stearoyl-CoA desaturase (delta-9 desaturase)